MLLLFRNSLEKQLFIIVDVFASTEAFVGTETSTTTCSSRKWATNGD